MMTFRWRYTRPDHGRDGPTRKSEDLGTKIWPDERVWAENKCSEFFWDGFGSGVWPGRPGPKGAKLVQLVTYFDYFIC